MEMIQIKRTINKQTMFLPLLALLSIALLGTSVSAQPDYQRGDASSVNHVTIYQECGFRGRSQAVKPGEYRKMRSVGFDNDAISSVRVPQGLELVIYEDQKFRGAYARINQDISCFDRQWDNNVSSLKVIGETVGRRDRGSDQRRYDNRDRDRRNNAREKNVTAKNLSQVVFNGIVLQQTNQAQWQMNSQRGGVSQFKETRRDRDSVYLQNVYTAEKIRIDLFANDVTFVSRDGRQQRFNIDRKQAAVTVAPNRPTPRPAREPDNRINGACFSYKAFTLGGEGGVRFHGKDGFNRFGKKVHTGRICHRGDLTMEINKTSPDTEVIIEIQGKQFRFAKGEKEDTYKNTWYRKRQTLVVGG